MGARLITERENPTLCPSKIGILLGEVVILKNEFEVRGDVTAIFLTSQKYGNTETLISTEKLQRAQEFPNTWCLHYDKSSGSYYAIGHMPVENRRRRDVSLHRWVKDAPSGMYVDHWNHNTLDNTDSNLRIVTISDNGQNRKGAMRNSKSGIIGVSWNEYMQKWKAEIRVEKKTIYLGYYADIQEAEHVVREARSKYMPYSKEASA